MYSNIVVEKETGYLYDFPTRFEQPIDSTDILSIRQGCFRTTPDELDEWETDVRAH
jgi:hypothetical protein